MPETNIVFGSETLCFKPALKYVQGYLRVFGNVGPETILQVRHEIDMLPHDGPFWLLNTRVQEIKGQVVVTGDIYKVLPKV